MRKGNIYPILAVVVSCILFSAVVTFMILPKNESATNTVTTNQVTTPGDECQTASDCSARPHIPEITFTCENGRCISHDNSAPLSATGVVSSESRSLETNGNSSLNTETIANQNSNTNTASDETTGWQTYTNTTYNFSFQYPDTWAVLKDAIQTTRQPSMPGNTLQLGVKVGDDFRPGMQLYVDPTGWGSCSTHTVVSVTREKGAFTIGDVTKTGAISGEFCLPDYYAVRASETNDPKVYYIDFYSNSASDSDHNFDALVRIILSTFTFTD